MSRSLICLMLLLTFALPGTATGADQVGSNGGHLEFGLMKLASGDHDYGNIGRNLSVGYRRLLSPRWTMVLGCKAGWSQAGIEESNGSSGWTFKGGAELYSVVIQPRLSFLFNLRPARSVSPYVGLGLGLTKLSVKGQRGNGLLPSGSNLDGFDYNGNETELSFTRLTGLFTTGCEFFIAHSAAIDCGIRLHLWPGNGTDTVGFSALDNDNRSGQASYGMIEGYIGVNFYFGNSDKDGDGIKNDVDGCPNLPEDFDDFEDLDGCPDPDNDQDGILDINDACRDNPEDIDGFEDEDGCPEPDNDQDGIFDQHDGCPNLPEDFDGYADQDGCPDLDNDGDGVLDTNDNCPSTPLGIEVDESGCPVVAEIKEKLILKGVNFKSGSAELTPSSLSVLEVVAYSLMAWPDVVIEVHGHTDSKGPASYNRDLSQRRAMAVRDYLLLLGIAPNRVMAIGFGEGFPIATNSTLEGRTLNRRVEIHRVNRD
ncbi:MAG: OmpA family protein [bacterium]|nr:OmpA family protein [bacterium]